MTAAITPLTERIARLCHEVNRAYCLALGDESQPVWEDAPDWQKTSIRKGVNLHIQNPDVGPQASHESWSVEKYAEGWTYGLVKDPAAKKHPCLVPFDQLPREQQAKDYLFRGVVLAAVSDHLFQHADHLESAPLRAQSMWAAYAFQAGGKTFDGKPLPSWEELGEERQACWIAAARV